MKITFFDARPRGRADAPPAISVRPKGQVTLNKAAVKLLEAEAGEAATLGYDEENKRWLLAHWPNGNAGQPELRASTAHSKESLRFQAAAPTTAFFEQLPVAQQLRTSVSCTLEVEPIQDAAFARVYFYALALPEELAKAIEKGGKRG